METTPKEGKLHTKTTSSSVVNKGKYYKLQSEGENTEKQEFRFTRWRWVALFSCVFVLLGHYF
jgi:hypothetical protein